MTQVLNFIYFVPKCQLTRIYIEVVKDNMWISHRGIRGLCRYIPLHTFVLLQGRDGLD